MTIKAKYTKKSLAQLEKIAGGKLILSRLIWAIRQSEEETQTDFAKKLDISKQQLCDIEHGRKSISPNLAASYARKLGYPEEQFVRLCLQEMVDKAKLNITVEVRLNTPKHQVFKWALAS
jgi:DNA-binding XRE family transcriptional regulator